MTNKKSRSSDFREALHILSSSQGKQMSSEQRQKRTIDLAAALLNEANRNMTRSEKQLQAELARMMRDPLGKVFTTSLTDQCFRSKSPARVADQLVYLLQQYGIPRYLNWTKRLSLRLFQSLGKPFAFVLVPLAIRTLKKATSKVILPGEKMPLHQHMKKRRLEGVRLNLNHLGEAILGEDEAKRRLDVYLDDLSEDNVEYISIKISTIYSQIHLLGWENTLETLAERLRLLYRAAMNNHFIRADGSKVMKFVNLDMEEYRDLVLTKELFKKVLNEPEFKQCFAGIVLQAYLPDAHPIQKELTEWAMRRVQEGGSPIKIRIVKGANLAMEQVEASLRGWPQAPYTKKADVDANYKQMVTYGCVPEHAQAVHLGIASHNLFDIAYALLSRAENNISHEVHFEMLEGMADHIRRVVQQLSGDMLLYCPVATNEDFQSAIAYLIRRLDENTGEDNFLRAIFGLKPGSHAWEEQTALFTAAFSQMQSVSAHPRRTQDRTQTPEGLKITAPFENEADSDFSLHANRLFAGEIAHKWEHAVPPPIPLMIAGREIWDTKAQGEGADPSKPKITAYRYALAEWKHIDEALKCAEEYTPPSVEERCRWLERAAQKMREKRGDLIGVMMLDGGKTILEGDPEVSEAIDFAEYYLRSLNELESHRQISHTPKGTCLVAPPWNFPISIPAGGILAAIAAGNSVLFKPAPEAVLSGWQLVNVLWDAGIPKTALQFINCNDDPVGSKLIADPRVNCIILTGATATAKLFYRLHPGIDLYAETGGKNAMIVTALSDRDLAIKDVCSSAFGHSGQKCSACSLLILEKEVYDDVNFRRQLKDAVESLKVGPCWDLSSKVTPVIRAAHDALVRGFIDLEKGETWLVEPRQHPLNPNLWSPGVKMGVKKGSFMHTTELFGPILAVMRAENLQDAIDIANSTDYGLTSGLQSLDEREQKLWMEKIEAGNCYINRGITGAIVRRQPFGGTKASSFGGGAKAGGPNYLFQFVHIADADVLPSEKATPKEVVAQLTPFVPKNQLEKWDATIRSYAHFAKYFAKDHDPSKLIGQDNLLRYRPHSNLCFRIQDNDPLFDVLRVLAALLSCKAPTLLSFSKENPHMHLVPLLEHSFKSIMEEGEDSFNTRIKQGAKCRLRLISPPSHPLKYAASESGSYLNTAPVLSSGRFELLHYLREISFSIDYHRYGNLGAREREARSPIL